MCICGCVCIYELCMRVCVCIFVHVPSSNKNEETNKAQNVGAVEQKQLILQFPASETPRPSADRCSLIEVDL